MRRHGSGPVSVVAGDRGWPALLGMGAAAALILVLGLVIGFFADKGLDTTPLFIMIGLALGIVGASRYVYVEFRKSLNN